MVLGTVVILIIVVLFVLLLAVINTVVVINGLVILRSNTKKNWANIDVLLIQKHEEILKLAEIAKGYGKFESETLAVIAGLCAQYGRLKKQNQKVVLENRLLAQAGRVITALEEYPGIRANELFARAMSKYTEIEQSIAQRRAFYNESVTLYNTEIQQYPQMIFAWIFLFRPALLLELPVRQEVKTTIGPN